jgi:acetyltransferase EpsM
MDFFSHSGDYVIFGAGGLGHEIWGWIKHSKNFGQAKRLLAFVDDNPALWGTEYDGIPIVGRDQFAGRAISYINAVGSSRARRVVSENLSGQGWHPLTYLHESVLVGINVEIGEGVIVCPRSTLSSDCRLGDHVLVNVGCGIGHDAAVGSFSILLGAVSLNGNVTVGESVTVGAGAVVHPGRRIGDGAVIGMSSAVFSHVKAGVTVVGNPAKKISA